MFYFKVNEDIVLHLLTEQYAEILLSLIEANKDLLERWQPGWTQITTIEQVKNYIRFNLERFAKNDGFMAAIYFQAEMAGVVSCNGVDWPTHSTNIGYWLAEKYQGRGIITKTCRALITYLFNEWKLNRIQIDPAEDNLKSRAVPERLGFKQEGIIRQRYCVNGRYIDGVIYGLLAADWFPSSGRIRE